MQQKLKQKLWAHIVVNNPELIIELEQDEILTGYLEEKVEAVLPLLEELTSEKKPDYIIEELCLRELTADMRPYRFNFILNVLEEQFPETHKAWQHNGILTHEVINFERYCRVSFEPLTLTWENVYEDHIYSMVTGQIQLYLEEQTALQHASELPEGE
jgi:hypothetical protein